DRIGLADRPTGLLDRRDGGEPFLAQPGERWVDRAIAGAEEMAERPFLEELLDLVPGRVAAAQCSEAGGPHIHAATPYIDSIYRTDRWRAGTRWQGGSAIFLLWFRSRSVGPDQAGRNRGSP